MKPQRAFWLGWLLLFATLLPALPYLLEFWLRHLRPQFFIPVTAGAFLLCAGSLTLLRGASVQAPRSAFFVRVFWWLALLGTWLAFWVLDLRHARFQWVLLACPLISLALVSCQAAAGRLDRCRALGACCIGVPLGLGVSLALMVPRADNGCTGVSDVYEVAEIITTFCLYLLGPDVLAPSIQRLWLDRS